MHSLLSLRQYAKKLNEQANGALLQMQLYQCWSCLAVSQERSAFLYCRTWSSKDLFKVNSVVGVSFPPETENVHPDCHMSMKIRVVVKA